MPLIRSSSYDPPIGAAPVESQTGLDGLESGDVEIRRAAVRRAHLPGEAPVLARRLVREGDAGVREAILTQLARIGGRQAARSLIDLLREDDVWLRNASIETLQCMGEPIVDEIEAMLDDDDPDHRIYAINILQTLRSPRAPDIALRIATHDPHVNVCAAAVDVLAEVGRPDMAVELSAVADRFPDRPFLAFAVRAAVNRIG